MNHVYRVVFNTQLGLWQAVCECARGRGKSDRARLSKPSLHDDTLCTATNNNANSSSVSRMLRQRARLLLAGTGFVLLAGFNPALAGGGAGSAGQLNGGFGGADNPAGTGGVGGNALALGFGGGGGGAGLTGGAGGGAFMSAAAGGAGGTQASRNGQDAASGDGVRLRCCGLPCSKCGNVVCVAHP